MPTGNHAALNEFFELYQSHDSTCEIARRWQTVRTSNSDEHIRPALLELYELAIDLIERDLWENDYPEETLALYYRLSQELESHLTIFHGDEQFEFVIVIPVADRPGHLENCLNSLLGLCQRFGYGQISGDRHRKVNILIADDSKEPLNICRIQELAAQFYEQGLTTIYFGQAEQLSLLNRLAQQDRRNLQTIIGTHEAEAFYHKGASITRNITYLKLADLPGDDVRRLFWFVDSDQEFVINASNDDRKIYAINYFHRLNQIFSTTDTQVLTGKVVGDPPVSPAVMAGSLLDDVLAFLASMAARNAQHSCQFHGHADIKPDNASYHDMRDLFGFELDGLSTEYRCRMDFSHDNLSCLRDFSEKLSLFFDGVHPTRGTHYEYHSSPADVAPARTVYTGNYVFRADALKYFIPFATLGLRMAGPVLGRILRSEEGCRFVSANLPLLHQRTLDLTRQAEFRPGVDKGEGRVELAGEYERQYYGDVMLFTVEGVIEQGFPGKSVSTGKTSEILYQVEADLRGKYNAQLTRTQDRLNLLRSYFDNKENWWNRMPDNPGIIVNFRRFLDNIEHNFGSHSAAHRLVNSCKHRNKRCKEILHAIMGFVNDRKHWLDTLSNK